MHFTAQHLGNQKLARSYTVLLHSQRKVSNTHADTTATTTRKLARGQSYIAHYDFSVGCKAVVTRPAKQARLRDKSAHYKEENPIQRRRPKRHQHLLQTLRNVVPSNKTSKLHHPTVSSYPRCARCTRVTTRSTPPPRHDLRHAARSSASFSSTATRHLLAATEPPLGWTLRGAVVVYSMYQYATKIRSACAHNDRQHSNTNGFLLRRTARDCNPRAGPAGRPLAIRNAAPALEPRRKAPP